jgi:hypothetical protein
MELMKLKGTNGTVIAYDDRVVIERAGFVASMVQGFRGSKSYFYSDLTSVGYKKPGAINGYIQFVTAGSNSGSPKSDLWGTSKETMQDENIVVLRAFDKTVPEKSEQLYNLILDKMAQSKRNTNQHATSVSSADEIGKYNDLFQQGIITENEFLAKKKQLLGL